MLSLCITFLVGLYFAKIFFPKEFMMSIQNERIVKIGTYIDNHKWLYYIIALVPPFIVYYLYCCACCEKKHLNKYETLLVLALVVIIRALSFLDDNIATALEHTAFVFMPFLMKGFLKNVTICFTVHSFSQVLSLGIRNLPMYLVNINFVTAIFMTFECYLWLTLLYLIFNNKKEKEI